MSFELLKDKKNLFSLENEISKLEMEKNFKELSVREKDNVLREYEAILKEANNAYNKVINNTS